MVNKSREIESGNKPEPPKAIEVPQPDAISQIKQASSPSSSTMETAKQLNADGKAKQALRAVSDFAKKPIEDRQERSQTYSKARQDLVTKHETFKQAKTKEERQAAKSELNEAKGWARKAREALEGGDVKLLESSMDFAAGALKLIPFAGPITRLIKLEIQKNSRKQGYGKSGRKLNKAQKLAALIGISFKEAFAATDLTLQAASGGSSAAAKASSAIKSGKEFTDTIRTVKNLGAAKKAFKEGKSGTGALRVAEVGFDELGDELLNSGNTVGAIGAEILGRVAKYAAENTANPESELSQAA